MSTNGPPNFGLPPRPPTTSTPLWARILEPKSRLPSSLAEMPSAVPLPAPLDKNATSMRILLHDTQANLEKFGEHVQKLVEGVKETKHEIKTTNTLFERDRETLIGDITDLVNRSQKEIQKAIGSPASNESVQSFFKDVNGRLTELDHRINSIQAFNQTHSQALQSQMQAVQILLDKQGSILTAVMPLLPLLQALPLHIDGAKTSICENLTKILSHIPAPPTDTTARTPEGAPSVKESRKRKHADVSSTTSSSSPTPYPRTFSQKRTRTEFPSYSTPDLVQKSAAPSSAALSTATTIPGGQAPSRRNRSVSGISPPTHELTRSVATTTTATAAAGTSAAPSATPRSGGGTFAVPTFSTPIHRRPLSDLLPLPPSRQDSRPTPRKQALTSMPSSVSSSSRRLRGTGPLNFRSRANTSASAPAETSLNMKPANIHRVYAADTPPGTRRLSINSDVLSPPRNSVQRRPTLSLASPAGRNKEPEEHSTTASGTCQEATAESDAGALRPGIVLQNKATKQAGDTGNSSDRTQAQAQAHAQTAAAALPSAYLNSAQHNLQKGNRSNIPILGKERWSPVREGRRFIPLVDSEDEEDGENE